MPGELGLCKRAQDFRLVPKGRACHTSVGTMYESYRQDIKACFSSISAGQQRISVCQAFEWLPLACLIDDQILTVHGGIGDGKWTIAELSCVERPLNSEDFHMPERRWLYNILWSDPIAEDENLQESGMVFGVHSSPRNASAVKFGWNVTKTFCALNGIGLVVRSHQCSERGRGFEVMHDEKLMRVFSARDYEEHRNDGAVLSIERRGNDDCRSPLTVRAQVLKSLENVRASNGTGI